jgi:DNA-binding transcriptional LysR family regulator
MADLDRYIRVSLKPRHLQLLVSLDDFRNVGKVAHYLNVTQPAISKALGELEHGLDVKLFERTARGIVPTALGDCMVRHARGVLADLSRARDEMRALMTGASGKVAVGVLAAAAPVLIPKSVAELKRRSPKTTMVLQEGAADTLLARLREGTLDFVVGTLPPQRMLSGIAHRVLCPEEPIVLVAGSHHPLRKRHKLAWRDLHGYPWILPPSGTLMREPLEQLFTEHDMPFPNDCVESLSILANKTILQETFAIALFSRRIAEHYRELGIIAILPLELEQLVGPVAMMWAQDRPFSPAAELMMSCLAVTGEALSAASPDA